MIFYGSMKITVESVTPEVAKRWLSENTNNRRLRATIVTQYARDMSAGDWLHKPVAICFDESGRLGNGQHTLSAIVLSGKAQTLLVARGVTRQSIAVMDLGVRRTISDVACFLGADMSGKKASVAKVMEWGPTGNTPRSFDEVFSVYQKFQPAIDFVCDRAPNSVGFSACVLAVCARAWFTCDHDKLHRFLELLKTGIPSGDHESAAIRLRDYARSLRNASGSTVRLETYQKTESALSWFLKGKPMGKVYGSSTELFKIPEGSIPQVGRLS